MSAEEFSATESESNYSDCMKVEGTKSNGEMFSFSMDVSDVSIILPENQLAQLKSIDTDSLMQLKNNVLEVKIQSVKINVRTFKDRVIQIQASPIQLLSGQYQKETRKSSEKRIFDYFNKSDNGTSK